MHFRCGYHALDPELGIARPITRFTMNTPRKLRYNTFRTNSCLRPYNARYRRNTTHWRISFCEEMTKRTTNVNPKIRRSLSTSHDHPSPAARKAKNHDFISRDSRSLAPASPSIASSLSIPSYLFLPEPHNLRALSALSFASSAIILLPIPRHSSSPGAPTKLEVHVFASVPLVKSPLLPPTPSPHPPSMPFEHLLHDFHSFFLVPLLLQFLFPRVSAS